MNKKALLFLSLACMMASIALMALPFSAVLRFAEGPDKGIFRSYSYFSPIIWGYGNGFAFLTAALSIVSLLILLWIAASRKDSPKRERVAEICSGACVITSVLSLPLLGRIGIINIAICVLLAAAVAMLSFYSESRKRSR